MSLWRFGPSQGSNLDLANNRILSDAIWVSGYALACQPFLSSHTQARIAPQCARLHWPAPRTAKDLKGAIYVEQTGETKTPQIDVYGLRDIHRREARSWNRLLYDERDEDRVEYYETYAVQQLETVLRVPTRELGISIVDYNMINTSHIDYEEACIDVKGRYEHKSASEHVKITQ